jgi:hypothetical protein
MMEASLSGTSRLAYAVVPLKEEVTRFITRWSREKGLYDEPVKEPGGYLVYFPRGHCLRLTEKELKRYRLDKKPKLLVDMSQMYDPNSPLGKLFLSQSESERANSWKDLEKQVIQLATARTGPIQVTKVSTPTEREERA